MEKETPLDEHQKFREMMIMEVGVIKRDVKALIETITKLEKRLVGENGTNGEIGTIKNRITSLEQFKWQAFAIMGFISTILLVIQALQPILLIKKP